MVPNFHCIWKNTLGRAMSHSIQPSSNWRLLSPETVLTFPIHHTCSARVYSTITQVAKPDVSIHLIVKAFGSSSHHYSTTLTHTPLSRRRMSCKQPQFQVRQRTHPPPQPQKQCPEGLIPPTCSKQQVEIQPLLQAIWKLRVMLKISKHHLLEEYTS